MWWWLKVSSWRFQPSVTCSARQAVGGSRRIYPPVPDGAERGTGGGCCLVQVASWMEGKGAGGGVTSLRGNEKGYFVSLSSSGNRITVGYTEGQGGSRQRMTNSWRWARKTDVETNKERDKLKLFIYGYSLVPFWSCGGAFVCLFCCFSPGEA